MFSLKNPSLLPAVFLKFRWNYGSLLFTAWELFAKLY